MKASITLNGVEVDRLQKAKQQKMDFSGIDQIGCLKLCVIKIDRSDSSPLRNGSKFALEISLKSIGENMSSAVNRAGASLARRMNKQYAIEMKLGLAHHSVQDHIPSQTFSLKGIMVQRSTEAKRLF